MKADIRRAVERRARYTRTGGRDMLTNSPAGFPSGTPWIGQPSRGFTNPGFSWLGSDSWGVLSGGEGEKLAAVSRALALIAGSIGGLPWKVRRNETETLVTPPWIEDPQLLRMDNRIATVDMRGWENRLSAVAFREQIVTSLLLRGNAFIFVPVRDSRTGAPVPPLFLLNPVDVDCRDGGYWVGGERLPDRAVIHVRGKGPLDEHGCGKGVLDAHAESLGLLTRATRKADESLSAPVPAGVLEVGSGYPMSDADAAGLRGQWEEMHAGKYGVAVLNSTVTFKPLSWSPESLQLLGMADFGLKMVALAFGLSPSWFGVPDNSLTYSTVVMRAAELRQFSLLSWVRRIESAFDAELPKGTELDILLDGLERGTTKERYDAYEVAIRSGFMTVDSARQLEGWEPLGGGGSVG